MGIFTRTGYNKKYCILHPWEVVMHKCRDIKCAWQRARKGYCFRDVWAIDDWFAKVFPAMLEELIEVHHGHPADLTDDEWVKILQKMSVSFRNADEEKTEFVNPYEEEYLDTLDMDFENHQLICSASEELEQNYREYEKQKEEFMKKSLDEGMQLFNKYFYALWD